MTLRMLAVVPIMLACCPRAATRVEQSGAQQQFIGEAKTSCGGLVRFHAGCDLVLCNANWYRFSEARVAAFFQHERKSVLLQMVREPYPTPDSDVVYVTQGESETDLEVVHVTLPDGFGGALSEDERKTLPAPSVRRAGIDSDTAQLLTGIWSDMLSGANTVAPPNHGDIHGRTRFVFASRIGEAAKTEHLGDGTCAGAIAELGLMLMGLADANESEAATRLHAVKERARALAARLR